MATHRLPKLFDINTGVSTFTGDDLITVFTIPHGLDGIPIPIVNRRIDPNSNLFQCWADEDNITITFNSTPEGGVDIELNWIAILPL